MLKEINDATDVNSPEEDLLKRVQISIDEDKAKRLNLDKASVASAVYSAFSRMRSLFLKTKMAKSMSFTCVLMINLEAIQMIS